MSSQDTESAVDVGAYCRAVEAHLTRVNEGEIVRIVGPAFELVRGWAMAGVPLSVVCQGISQKADRHRAGASRHPLRAEFCEADVRAVFDAWRRAVGIARPDAPTDAPAERKRAPSLTKHLDRVLERLGRAAGRLDVPEQIRAAVDAAIADVAAIAERARGTRGADRVALASALPAIEARLLEHVRAALTGEAREALDRDASDELAAYRARLTGDAWTDSVRAGGNRLLAERIGLPTIAFDG